MCPLIWIRLVNHQIGPPAVGPFDQAPGQDAGAFAPLRTLKNSITGEVKHPMEILVSALAELGRVVSLGRAEDMDVEVEIMLFDFIGPTSLEGVWANDNHPIDQVLLLQEVELGQG